MKGSLKLPKATRGLVGSAFLALALTGQAWAATITGTVTPAEGRDVFGSFVIATSANYETYRVEVAEDGTYAIEDVAAGTYTISVIGLGMTAPDVKDVVVAEDADVTQNFTLTEREPFCVVKSPTPIPLTEGIDSAAFADAPLIEINSGKHVGVGDPLLWGELGGPSVVSGRFKVKYSDQAIHLAGDVTFKTPLVNIQSDGNLWNGNALEFDLQNDPYDPDRTGKDNMHNWQVVVGLGEQADWWEHNVYNMRPQANGQEVPITAYIRRQQKEDGTGETFRLDLPWAIFLQGGAEGDPISVPEDNALGAMDIVIDAADPEADRTEAVRLFQVQWSGYGQSHWNASQMVPVQFCPQPPAAGQ